MHTCLYVYCLYMYSLCNSPTGSCGGVYPIRTHGTISSPLLPDGYASWLRCHWVVEAKLGQEIELRLEESHLEEDYDILTVCNGPVCLSSNILVKVTGGCGIMVCLVLLCLILLCVYTNVFT